MPPHLALAVDKVRYVGDAVAVVIAGNRYQAADALEAIEVDYEPLPPVLDMRAALEEGSTAVHDDPGTNKCYTWKLADGDYEAAKAKADRVFTRHYVNQRLIPMAMEPRAVVAAPSGAGRRRHPVVVHPDPAHRAGAAGAHDRASRRTRSGWSPPTSAAASAPSCSSTARRSSRRWWPRCSAGR